jgi:predicted nucleic acid-binding protein
MALVSLLFSDEHSAKAMKCARTPGVHLISSLACAETLSVIARIERDHQISAVLVDAARDTLAHGPWRRLHVEPQCELIERLAKKWPVRGADLWHLAAAKQLQIEIPELHLLSFDSRLDVAAEGEGLPRPR